MRTNQTPYEAPFSQVPETSAGHSDVKTQLERVLCRVGTLEASSKSMERRLRRLEQISIKTMTQEAQAEALHTALADGRFNRDELISVHSDGERGRRRPGRDRSCDSAESTFSRPASSRCSSFRAATVPLTLPPYVPSRVHVVLERVG